jgi:DNA-directed RNA polymerase
MTFRQYTGWQWLLIDAANHFGLDKLLFEERIEWVEERLAGMLEYLR